MQRLLTVPLVFLVASLASEMPDEASQGQKTALESLRSTDIHQRGTAKQEILRERTALVQALVEIIRSEGGGQENGPMDGRPWLSSKHLALTLLGELRAEEGIDVLMANLTYRVRPLFGGLMETCSVGAQFPAAQSLARIRGPAAVHAILARLRSTEDPLERHLCVWALMAMDGPDVARFRVEKAIKDCAAYTAWKANLEAALKCFEKKNLGLVPDMGTGGAEDK